MALHWMTVTRMLVRLAAGQKLTHSFVCVAYHLSSPLRLRAIAPSGWLENEQLYAQAG